MRHLSEEQFVAWASGERDEQVAQHLRDCAACLAEVRELNTALEGFKAEVKQHTDARVPFSGAEVRARAAAEAKPKWSFWRIVPVPALAAAAVLAIMLYKPTPTQVPVAHPPQQVAANDQADDALLLAINADLNYASPAALRPVAKLHKERNQLLTSSQRKK